MMIYPERLAAMTCFRMFFIICETTSLVIGKDTRTFGRSFGVSNTGSVEDG